MSIKNNCMCDPFSNCVAHWFQCYPNLKARPQSADGIVSIIPSEPRERVVRKAARVGIKRIRMQPGAESENAIHFCYDADLNLFYGRCVMVLSVPVDAGNEDF